MSIIERFSDSTSGGGDSQGIWSRVTLDSGEPVWISITKSGVIIKKSRLGIFGQKIYHETNKDNLVKCLENIYCSLSKYTTPYEMKQPVLKAFTQAALESKSINDLKSFIQDGSINAENSQHNNLSKKEAEVIVKEYGNTIENNSPQPQNVSDTKNLPYSKETIKKAIIVFLQNTSDENMKKRLKFCYTLLANWQDDVGDEDIGIKLLNKDLDSGDTSQDVRDFQEQFRKYEEWKPLVESEEKELYKELQELGYH